MRILIVHNMYRSNQPSGENSVFEAERQLLAKAGHDVEVFVRESDSLERWGAAAPIVGGLLTPFNPVSALQIRRVQKSFRPDVVHIHNVFPLISPSVLFGLDAEVPVVMTLHNMRMFCAAADPLRDGRICLDCIDQRSVMPALRHGCYRGSKAATVPLAASIALHRGLGTWERRVDRFLALTEFHRQLFVSAGLAASKIVVKPNFVKVPGSGVARVDRPDDVVYAGRLSEPKGIRVLLEAWRMLGVDAPRLRIVGDGQLRGEVEAAVALGGGRIRYDGPRTHAETMAIIGGAKLAVMPSLSMEGLPMVLIEAFSAGTPVLGSALGAMGSLVAEGRTGRTVKAGEAALLAQAVRDLFGDPRTLSRMSREALVAYKDQYTAESCLARLESVYETVSLGRMADRMGVV
jgi:glycosyltransferase involved in cell wall biosynthesis